MGQELVCSDASEVRMQKEIPLEYPSSQGEMVVLSS